MQKEERPAENTELCNLMTESLLQCACIVDLGVARGSAPDLSF
jgi:hypothetical protein